MTWSRAYYLFVIGFNSTTFRFVQSYILPGHHALLCTVGFNEQKQFFSVIIIGRAYSQWAKLPISIICCKHAQLQIM